MRIHTTGPGAKVLRTCLVAGASSAALLGFSAAPALASYTAQVQGGTLQIAGDGASDKLAVSVDPANPSNVLVDVGEDGTIDFSFDRSTFTAINVQAGGGDDTVDIANGVGNVTIDGGPGNDTLRSGDGNDVLIGGSGRDFIDGGRGSDTALLGAGNDTFQWDPGDGSDTVEGQDGKDVLDFNGSNASENMTVSQNGSRVRFFRDVANITMDLNGIEGLNVNALGGADTITVDDLTGTDLKAANVDLSAQGAGDGAADTVLVNGTDGPDAVNVASKAGGVVVSGLAAQVQVAGSEAGQDNVDLSTRGGDDTINSGAGVTGPAAINIDGGEGSDTTTYNGTAAADTIGIAPNGTAVDTFAAGTGSSPQNTTAVESLAVNGLGGDDTIVANNGLAALTKLAIDGGAGNDTLRGGDGDDVLNGGSGNDVVDGGRGSDVAFLGGGDDSFTWDPGDGSDTVEGQGGSDVLDFNGSNASESMTVSANGSRVRFFRDVANITMDLDGIEGLNVNALGGTDTITVDDLTGTDLKDTNLDLTALGGGGDGQADTVIANGTAGPDHVNVTRFGSQVHVRGLATRMSIVGGEASNDQLGINTLGGADKVAVAPDVSQLIAPVVDLGADQ
jgi:Ca2+-binding RTX toxin-like protein